MARAVWIVPLTFGALGCGGQVVASEVIVNASDAAVLSPSCSTLLSCCAGLPPTVATSCRDLSSQASEASCGLALTALSAAGQCIGDAGTGDASEAPRDASVVRDGAAIANARTSDAGPPALGCILLETCCAGGAVPAGELATCQSIQGSGDDAECTSLLNDLASSQACGSPSYGSGGACPELMQCCASTALPSNFSTVCATTVTAGDDSACASTLASLVPAGYCGGAVPVADGGEQPNPDCAALQLCCDEATFPMDTLSTCQQVAAANEDGNCSSAYDTYAALGYCAGSP